MPARLRFRKYVRRGPKTSKRRRLYVPRTVTTRNRFSGARGQPRPLSASIGFPAMLKVKHCYTRNKNEVVASTPESKYNWGIKANGLYEPDPTNPGGRPSNFGLMSAIYNHYRVIGAKVTWTLTYSGDRTIGWPVRLLSWLDDDGNNTQLPDVLSSQPGVQNKMTNLAAVSNVRLTRKWSMKKTFGRDAPISNLQGSSDSNPSELSWFMLGLTSGAPVPNDPETYQLNVNVRVEFIAVWSERKDNNL